MAAVVVKFRTQTVPNAFRQRRMKMFPHAGYIQKLSMRQGDSPTHRGNIAIIVLFQKVAWYATSETNRHKPPKEMRAVFYFQNRQQALWVDGEIFLSSLSH
jgi:hypothetical protein